MFIVAIYVENSSVALIQVIKSLGYQFVITADITGHYTIWTGGLPGPIKTVPGFNVQVRN
jgi:hypothetical protein